MAPWWNVPYEEQTSRKEKEMRQVLKRCNRRINRKDHEKDKKKKKTGRAGTVDQPCRDFMSKGSCMYGDRCKYIHLTLDEYEERLKKEQEAKTVEETTEVKEKMAEETTEVKEKVEEETTEAKEKTADETTQEACATSPIEISSTSEQPAKEASDSEDYEKADEDEGQICSMLPILTHSKVEGYRNKCTFTIGKDRNGAPCIGFRMGSFINGNVIIGPVEYFTPPSPSPSSDVVVVSPLMKQVVKRVEAFIVSKSYQTYDMCQHLGFWRSLLLRYSERTNQLLILVVVGNPYERSLPKAQEALAKLTDATRSEIDGVMKELLAFVASEVSCIASFNYQMSLSLSCVELFRFTGLSMPGSDCPIVTLQGEPFIEERLFDLSFRVSPYAFFQVNTPVAEVLYKNIGDWLSLHENTLLLDVCCGTGTIGLCLANRVKFVWLRAISDECSSSAWTSRPRRSKMRD